VRSGVEPRGRKSRKRALGQKTVRGDKWGCSRVPGPTKARAASTKEIPTSVPAAQENSTGCDNPFHIRRVGKAGGGLKPNGVLFINVPSNGNVHRYPVDCWRFYPDSGMALQNWGRRSGYKTILLESFTGKQKGDVWNDFIAVFLKDERCAQEYSRKMRESVPDHANGFVYGSPVVSNPSAWQEDQKGHLNRKFRKDYMRKWIKARIDRVLGRAE